MHYGLVKPPLAVMLVALHPSPSLWTQAHLVPLPNIMGALNNIGKGKTIP